MRAIPDPIERGEARCEAWEVESVRGDSFICACGRWTRFVDAETLSPDPYAIPVCGQCFENAMDEKFGSSWRERM